MATRSTSSSGSTAKRPLNGTLLFRFGFLNKLCSPLAAGAAAAGDGVATSAAGVAAAAGVELSAVAAAGATAAGAAAAGADAGAAAAASGGCSPAEGTVHCTLPP